MGSDYYPPWFSRKRENTVRMMSVAESTDLHPVDVNVPSSAVVVKASSTDSGARAIAPSPTNAAGASVADSHAPHSTPY
jgi:hypothetical protein